MDAQISIGPCYHFSRSIWTSQTFSRAASGYSTPITKLVQRREKRNSRDSDQPQRVEDWRSNSRQEDSDEFSGDKRMKNTYKLKNTNERMDREKEEKVISTSTLKKREKFERRLVKYNDLPEYLQDNECILDYYRCEWPVKDAFLSVFSLHNESLNVWT